MYARQVTSYTSSHNRGGMEERSELEAAQQRHRSVAQDHALHVSRSVLWAISVSAECATRTIVHHHPQQLSLPIHQQIAQTSMVRRSEQFLDVHN